ncbi:DUF445 domain-containing protein [Mesobacillus harenae]|uniref:DUF445 domain-containing protein n=1 Tax=Mesobacillus harenae TaxID=2213203 RepID=UPI001F558C5A|nr:DUF445 family protein [Mesobacillus harenae]
MHWILIILIMMIIGALIGGVTNSLAIKMLFRPYKAIYLGKWRVPFTPGLIPKRREELAHQLGKMVVDHLLTPESFQRKLTEPGFQEDMTLVFQKELERLLDTKQTPAELLQSFGVAEGTLRSERWLDNFIESKYEETMNRFRPLTLRETLSPELIQKANTEIPGFAKLLVAKGTDYFSSKEGKARIQSMLEEFVNERGGMLKSMLQMFLGNASLADKIQPEIIKFLNSKGTEELITSLMRKEWDNILEWETEKVEMYFDRDSVVKTIKEYTRKVINMEEYMNKPVTILFSSYKEMIIGNFAPKAVTMMGQWLSERIGVMMDKLHLAEIVREQVETFSVERLEELVLSITRDELKMITYLGALLGGLIGIIQGLLALSL